MPKYWGKQIFGYRSVPEVGERIEGVEEEKVGENNGQLRFHPPPRVAHESHLDQKGRKK